ncbi:uroporphyrinogen-III C-methyltransferase [Thiomonas intermedia]|uniref:uroporphyrinogen-III C-methyltransferase n=1 Tax=Thiomonas intermedia TaxID=926 RepID=UPI0009A4FAE9|nr:uroporphyrinogen-III C-methyltransferase [Thiomonas intermedia]
MTESSTPSAAEPSSAVGTAPAERVTPAPASLADTPSTSGAHPAIAGLPGARWVWPVLVALIIGLVVMAAWLNSRLYATQSEIAQRLQAATTNAIEAKTLTRQASDSVRDLTARIAVLESRQQDFAAQRQALEALYEDFAKSRDQARLSETGQLIALAQQQAQLVGNVQPLIATLQSADARLARSPNPKAQILRRAVQTDLARLRSAVTPDIAAAAHKLNDLAALVDDLRLISSAAPLHEAHAPDAAPVGAASASAAGPRWAPWMGAWFERFRTSLVQLFGVTRVDSRDALLASPEQGEFLRENLKLRILNARLDLLSRNAVAYRSDMRGIDEALKTYFDRRQPRMVQALSLARQASQLDLSANPAANLESLAVLSTLDSGAP